MTPSKIYQAKCTAGDIERDALQLAVLSVFDRIALELIQELAKRSSVLGLLRKPKTVPGLYLWGGVGIGKTFLLDCFYASLPFTNKHRIHFHALMR